MHSEYRKVCIMKYKAKSDCLQEQTDKHSISCSLTLSVPFLLYWLMLSLKKELIMTRIL